MKLKFLVEMLEYSSLVSTIPVNNYFPAQSYGAYSQGMGSLVRAVLGHNWGTAQESQHLIFFGSGMTAGLPLSILWTNERVMNHSCLKGCQTRQLNGMNPQHVKAQFREHIVKLCQPQRTRRNSQKAKEQVEKSPVKVLLKGLGGKHFSSLRTYFSFKRPFGLLLQRNCREYLLKNTLIYWPSGTLLDKTQVQ